MVIRGKVQHAQLALEVNIALQSLHLKRMPLVCRFFAMNLLRTSERNEHLNTNPALESTGAEVSPNRGAAEALSSRCIHKKHHAAQFQRPVRRESWLQINKTKQRRHKAKETSKRNLLLFQVLLHFAESLRITGKICHLSHGHIKGNKHKCLPDKLAGVGANKPPLTKS